MIAMDANVLATLGTGRFSKVSCMRRDDGSLCAVKRVSLDDIRRLGRTQRVLDEKEALRRMQEVIAKHSTFMICCQCSYSVHLFDTGKYESELQFILSAELGGSLQQHIRLSGAFDFDTLAIYCAELLAVLQHMAKQNIIHRDIKANNVLLSKFGHLKVCDFGSAKVFPINDSTSRTHTLAGTRHAMAPEMVAWAGDVSTSGYDRAIDWWSAGCLMLEMATGTVAFNRAECFPTAADVSAARLALTEGGSMWDWKSATCNSLSDAPQFCCLINRLLVIDSAARATCLSAYQDLAFFAHVDWEALLNGNLPPLAFDRAIGYLDIIDCDTAAGDELNAEQQALFADF